MKKMSVVFLLCVMLAPGVVFSAEKSVLGGTELGNRAAQQLNGLPKENNVLLTSKQNSVFKGTTAVCTKKVQIDGRYIYGTGGELIWAPPETITIKEPCHQ